MMMRIIFLNPLSIKVLFCQVPIKPYSLDSRLRGNDGLFFMNSLIHYSNTSPYASPPSHYASPPSHYASPPSSDASTPSSDASPSSSPNVSIGDPCRNAIAFPSKSQPHVLKDNWIPVFTGMTASFFMSAPIHHSNTSPYTSPSSSDASTPLPYASLPSSPNVSIGDPCRNAIAFPSKNQPHVLKDNWIPAPRLRGGRLCAGMTVCSL